MGGQVALALVLLVSSGLMVRSFQKLRALDPGFDARPRSPSASDCRDRDYPRSTRGRRRASRDSRPAVGAAGRDGRVGIDVPAARGACSGNTVRVEGRVVPARHRPASRAVPRASPAATSRRWASGLIRGRGIDWGNVERSEPVVVVDEVFAERFFPDQDPIGEHVASNRPPARPGETPSSTWLTIVGVVSNTPTRALAETQPDSPAVHADVHRRRAGHPQLRLVGPDVAVMSYVVRSATAAVRAAAVRAARH